MRCIAEGLRAGLPATAERNGVAVGEVELVAVDVDDPHRPGHLVRAVVADLDLDLVTLHLSEDNAVVDSGLYCLLSSGAA